MSISPALDTIPVPPTRLGIWLAATRPKTLPAACAPVLIGCAVAAHAGGFALAPALAALGSALLLQIGANLSNDYFDFLKGADGPDRLGPPRATQQGWVTPREMAMATALVFALAAAVGGYLAWVGGWPILAAGVLAVLTALAYTGGPFPLAYIGLGEVAAFVFFGGVAVVCTTYAQLHVWSPLACLLAIGPGMLAAALLGVNNLRDHIGDARSQKHTLAVRFGVPVARKLYLAELGVAFALPVVLVATHMVGWGALLALLALPAAIAPTQRVLHVEGAPLNLALAGTAKLLLLYGVLTAIGVTWAG